jgi:CheY-like chemotaxis protein
MMVRVWAPLRSTAIGACEAPATSWFAGLFGIGGERLRQQRPLVVQEDASEPEVSEQAQADAAHVITLAGKRILICEDEGISQMQLRRALTRGGLVVVGAAANGKMAVDLAMKTRPDIILMDIRMPVMDGIEALRRIRQHLQPCIIMLTAFSDNEYRQEASEAGASGYIVKPVTGDTLLPAIEKVWTQFSGPE